jgi:hypothetical protein
MEEVSKSPRYMRLGKISPIGFLLCRPPYNKRISSGKRGNQLQIDRNSRKNLDCVITATAARWD